MSFETVKNQIQEEFNRLQSPLQKELEKCRIDVSIELPPPELAWEVFSNTQSSFALVGTLGNFTLVKGKAKSKKSFFMSMALAAAESGSLQDFIRSPLKDSQNKVFYFDTEQSKYHVQRAVKRICSLLSIDLPANIDTFGLRSHKPSQRLEIVEYAIRNTNGLGFVVIDGIKDLITSINDEAESTMISSKLLEWSETYNIHIIVVLHENPTGEKARGHIGTELTNKAEAVISVERDKKIDNVSIVRPAYCRHKEFDEFAFEIDNHGLPVILPTFEPTKYSSKFDILQLSEEQKYELFSRVFEQSKEYTHSALVSEIKKQADILYTSKSGKGENKIKQLITEARDSGVLFQEGDRMPYKFSQNNKV